MGSACWLHVGPVVAVLTIPLVCVLACSKKPSTTEVTATDASNGANAADADPGDGAARLAMPPRSLLGLDWLPVPPSPKVEVVPDQHPAIVAMPVATLDRSFLVELAVGGGPQGYTILTLPVSGHAGLVFDTRLDGKQIWHAVAFEVSGKELEEVVQVLNDERVMTLAQSYVHPIHDGTQWILHIRTNFRDKYIVASNEFPAQLLRFAQHLRDQLVDTRPDLLARSHIVTSGDVYSHRLQREEWEYRGLPKVGAGLWDKPAVMVFPKWMKLIGTHTEAAVQPTNSRIEAEIQDWSANGEVLFRERNLVEPSWLFYQKNKVKPDHRLMLVLKLIQGKSIVTVSAPQPVITLDGVHALEVELVLP
jgi:hypothetical protein